LFVNSSKTPSQCKEKAQNSQQIIPNTLHWTPEEVSLSNNLSLLICPPPSQDEKLKAAVKLFQDSETQKVDWGQVSDFVSNRTRRQCLVRWTKHLSKPPSVQARWTAEEDRLLAEAVDYSSKQQAQNPTKGLCWITVSTRMNGIRSPSQCIDRWNRVHKHAGSIVRAMWQPHEVS
jgi:hypothetical protein